MTRTRNAGFVGAQIYEGDIDAIVYKRVLRELAHDLHAIEDIATGAHSPSVPPVVLTMNHSGILRGSLLGMPLLNQTIHRRIIMPAPDRAVYGGSIYLLAAPVFVSPGENAISVVVDAPGAPDMTLEVYDNAGVLQNELALTRDEDDQAQSCMTFLPARVAGEEYYFVIRCTLAEGSWTLIGWRIFVQRLRLAGGASDLPGQDGSTLMPVPVAGVGQSINLEVLHDEYFQDNYALAGKIPNIINRNINAIWEALTGAAIRGHGATTNTDSSATNPTTSRFIAKTRAGAELASEPTIAFPLFSEALGAVRATDTSDPVVNDETPPTEGLTRWFAPFPRELAASTGRKISVRVPDFVASPDSSMKGVILVATDPAKWSGDWEAQVKIDGVSADAWTSFTQIGATNFYKATMSIDDFTPDAVNEFSLQTRNLAGAFTFGELLVVGWGVYFES